jgi:hypothetical protein
VGDHRFGSRIVDNGGATDDELPLFSQAHASSSSATRTPKRLRNASEADDFEFSGVRSQPRRGHKRQFRRDNVFISPPRPSQPGSSFSFSELENCLW